MNSRDMWEAMRELSDKQFKIYTAVYKLADNDVGYCFASDIHIGDKVNKVRKNVNEGINELIKLGFLNVLKITQGTRVIERRLYPANCYKNYLKDSKLKIVKTTYEKKVDKNGVESIIYYNEKNLKNRTSNDSVTGTSNDSVTGTSNDSVTVTSTNTNISKINKLKTKKLELVPFENLFKELGINFTATNQKLVEKLLKTMSEKEVEKFLIDNYNAIVENKSVDDTIKSINALFVYYLKRGERIKKHEKNEIVETKNVKIKKEVIEIETKENKSIEITPELEKKAIDYLVEKEKLSMNFINETKRKSKFRYESMIKTALKEVV